jgi:hypothetical protein
VSVEILNRLSKRQANLCASLFLAKVIASSVINNLTLLAGLVIWPHCNSCFAFSG